MVGVARPPRLDVREGGIYALTRRAAYVIDGRWSGLSTPPSATPIAWAIRNLSPFDASRDVEPHATTTKRPSKQERGRLPVMRTDGIDDQPQTAAVGPLALPITHVWVGAWIAGDFIFDSPGGVTTARHSLRQVSGQFQLWNGSGASITLGPAVSGVWAIIVGIQNGASSKGWFNGGAAIISESNLSQPWGGVGYGSNWGGSSTALSSADTLAHWVFEGALNIHEINSLGAYYRDTIVRSAGTVSWTEATA